MSLHHQTELDDKFPSIVSSFVKFVQIILIRKLHSMFEVIGCSLWMEVKWQHSWFERKFVCKLIIKFLKYLFNLKDFKTRSSQCSNLCQLPNGYNSRCEQKYVQKRLLSLSPGGERLFTDTFWFPSCCVCTLSNSWFNQLALIQISVSSSFNLIKKINWFFVQSWFHGLN